MTHDSKRQGLLPRLMFTLALSLLMATTVACEPGETMPVGVVTPAAADLRPLDMAECEAIRQEMAETLNVDVSLVENPFQDAITGVAGASCRLQAVGTGRDFTHFVDVAGDMTALLEARGWQQAPQYAADSPTATVIGFDMNGALALLSVGWTPAPGLECPPEQPIAECAAQLPPEQMIYTITVDLAQQHSMGSN